MPDVLSAWLLDRAALRSLALRVAAAGLLGAVAGAVSGAANGPLRGALVVAAALLVVGLVERRARPGERADHARAALTVTLLVPVAAVLASLQADYLLLLLRQGTPPDVDELTWWLQRDLYLAVREPQELGWFAGAAAALGAATRWRLGWTSPSTPGDAGALLFGLAALAGGLGSAVMAIGNSEPRSQPLLVLGWAPVTAALLVLPAMVALGLLLGAPGAGPAPPPQADPR